MIFANGRTNRAKKQFLTRQEQHKECKTVHLFTVQLFTESSTSYDHIQNYRCFAKQTFFTAAAMFWWPITAWSSNWLEIWVQLPSHPTLRIRCINTHKPQSDARNHIPTNLSTSTQTRSTMVEKKLVTALQTTRGHHQLLAFFFFKRTMFVWEGRGSELVRLEENRHLLDLPRGWASLSLLIDFQARSCTGSDISDVHVPLWIIVGWVWESKSLLWVCRRLLQSRITSQSHAVVRVVCQWCAEQWRKVCFNPAQEKAREKSPSVQPGTSQT